MLRNEAEALLMETFSNPYEEIENEAGGTTVIINSTSDEPTTNPRVTLIIDEPTRTINYENELILGVVGDRFAERIYLQCPQYVHKENHTIDLALATTKIYINYQNAAGEPYIEECYKEGMLSNGGFMFSWLISDFVTVKNGKVKFNVCVKDESSTLTDYSGRVLIPEWHTTTYEGIILPAVDVTANTPEVLTSDTITSAEIIAAMNSYRYAVESLEEQLADTDAYIGERVEQEFVKVDERIDSIGNSITIVDETIGVRYLGTYENTYFDTSNDYLNNIINPGTYTFNVELNSSKVSYILIVNKSIVGTINQTVLGDLTSINRYATNRYKYPSDTKWTYDNTKKYFAYRDEIGVNYLGEYAGNPFDTNDDYLAPITTPGIYTFAKYISTNNTKIPYILVVSENAATLYQTVFKNLTTGDMVYSRRYLDRSVSETNWTVLTDSTIATTTHVATNYVKKDSLYLHNIHIKANNGSDDIDVFLQVLSSKSTSFNFNEYDSNSLLSHFTNMGYTTSDNPHMATGYRKAPGSDSSPLFSVYATGANTFGVSYGIPTGGTAASTSWNVTHATIFTDKVVKLI